MTRATARQDARKCPVASADAPVAPTQPVQGTKARAGAVRSKYGSSFVESDGIKFRSKREAARWKVLQIALKAGAIRNLRRQVPYELHAEGGALVGKYVADHVYEELTEGLWELVIEDVKGFPTPLFAWKARHLMAEYGIALKEV